MKLLKILFRMTFMPVAWTIRLMIATIAFVLSISTSLLSIVASIFTLLASFGIGAMGQVNIFTLLAVVMFIIGSNGNAFALLILAALISPMGLPAVADKLLDLMDRVLTRVTAIMY